MSRVLSFPTRNRAIRRVTTSVGDVMLMASNGEIKVFPTTDRSLTTGWMSIVKEECNNYLSTPEGRVLVHMAKVGRHAKELADMVNEQGQLKAKLDELDARIAAKQSIIEELQAAMPSMMAQRAAEQ